MQNRFCDEYGDMPQALAEFHAGVDRITFDVPYGGERRGEEGMEVFIRGFALSGAPLLTDFGECLYRGGKSLTAIVRLENAIERQDNENAAPVISLTEAAGKGESI